MSQTTAPPPEITTPPRIGPLDLTPTGRLPHTVAAYRTDTTARTALTALDAATTLRTATARLAGLYGAEPAFSVNRHRVHLVIHPRDGEPADRIEALAGDVALLTDADLHPDVDPADLAITLTSSGVHGTTGVWVSAVVPDCVTEDGR